MTGDVRRARGNGRSAGTGGAAGRAAGAIADHPLVEAGARAGYVVLGVLHLLLAWLALQVAFGNGRADADPSGALQIIAGSPMGWVLLVVVVVAFALLAVWQLGECVRDREWTDRAKHVGKAALYLSLGAASVSFLQGAGNSSSAQAKDATTMLMELPFGTVLVVLVGVAVVAIGGYHVYKGWTERFLQDLATDPGPLLVHAGRIGYVAKGLALVAIGVGLVIAGIRHDPSRSRGLDGALNDVSRLPMGQALLVAVALGFAAYGVYSFARARHADA